MLRFACFNSYRRYSLRDITGSKLHAPAPEISKQSTEVDDKEGVLVRLSRNFKGTTNICVHVLVAFIVIHETRHVHILKIENAYVVYTLYASIQCERMETAVYVTSVLIASSRREKKK